MPSNTMLDKLLSVIALFQKNKVDYCLIGGLAVMLHNGRANTIDMDFYVLVEDLKTVFDLLTKEGLEVRTAGEYQLKAKYDGVPIDLLFADHYVGADVVRRAISVPLGERVVRVATAEDIIVLKTIANRSVDRRDIEELREIYGKQLNEKYIQKKLKEVNELLKG